MVMGITSHPFSVERVGEARAMPEHFPLMVPAAAAARRQISAPFDRAPIATVEQVDRAGAERALATADALCFAIATLG